jgi:hypothetical protein
MAAGNALVGALKDQLTATAEMASGQLGATSANAALLGVGFAESSKLTDKISSDLAIAANKLPGATKDYLEAFNGVSDTLVMSGAMTKKGLTESGREMVELTALLGQASKAGSATTSTVLGKMIGDSGSEALFRIDAFEKVPAFKAILEKDLEKAGKNLGDFFKLSSAEKTKYLVGVKRSLFSQDYIDQMNQAADAQLDTMKSQLFDPVGGLFGFLRKVKIGGAETTVWAEVGKLMGAIREAGTSLLNALGLTGDPLPTLIAGIRSLTNWLKSTGKALNGVQLGTFSIGDMIGKLSSGVTGWLAGMITMVRDGLNSAGGGAAVGAKLGKALMDGLSALWAATPAIVQTVVLPTLQIGLEVLGGVIIGILHGLPGFVVAMVQGIGGVLMAQISFFGAAMAGWMGQVGSIIYGTASSIASGFQGAASGFLSGIVSGFTSGASAIASGLQGAVSGFIAPLKGAFDGAIGAIQSAMNTVVGAINSITAYIPGMGSGQSKYSGQNTNLLNRDMMSGSNRIGAVGTAFQGNLLDAISAESRQKPSGSSLVIANSSELIVPRDKIKDINQPLQMNFTINGSTKEQILRQVGAQLDRVTRLPRIATV